MKFLYQFIVIGLLAFNSLSADQHHKQNNAIAITYRVYCNQQQYSKKHVSGLTKKLIANLQARPKHNQETELERCQTLMRKYLKKLKKYSAAGCQFKSEYATCFVDPNSIPSIHYPAKMPDNANAIAVTLLLAFNNPDYRLGQMMDSLYDSPVDACDQIKILQRKQDWLSQREIFLCSHTITAYHKEIVAQS